MDRQWRVLLVIPLLLCLVVGVPFLLSLFLHQFPMGNGSDAGTGMSLASFMEGKQSKILA